MRWTTILIASFGLGVCPAQGAYQFEKARQQIRAHIEAGKVPAFAVAVARDGEILWEEAFGLADVERGTPATVHTMFSLASVSKPITATGLMILVERGDIDLDGPINSYLGEARLRARAGRPEDASVRRVANHTAGLPLHHHFFPVSDPGPPDAAETIRRYGDLMTEPGKEFQYSNLGYGVLEHALETVGGRDFPTFMEREVFLPLGLKHTAIVLDPEAETRTLAARYDRQLKPISFYDFDHRGASAVYASVHDLVRFGMFHVGTSLEEQKPLLPMRAVSEMQRPKALMPNGGRYGIGWMVYERERGGRVIEHGGGMPGVSTLLQLIPSQEIVVTTLASTQTDLSRRVAEDVLSELLPRGLRLQKSSSRKGRPGSAKPPRAYRGAWEGEVHTYEGGVPLRLNIDEHSGLCLQLDDRSPVSPIGVVFDGEGLRGVADENLSTRDTRDAEALRFSFTRRGDVLRGTVVAVASGNEGFPLALSHWTVLQKKASNELRLTESCPGRISGR